MPVTIRERPHSLDFAGNRTRFLLKGTPLVTAGSKSKSVFIIRELPDSVLTVSCGDTVFDFRILTPTQAKDKPDAIARQTDSELLQAELISKIAENYTISHLYDVTVAADMTVTFVSKEYGGEVVSVDGNGSGDIETVQQTAGTARVERANYAVLAKFEITRYSGGTVETLESPEMLLHLKAGNLAELQLEILRSYFTAADLPSLTESFDAYPLLYATLKYRLTYSDVYGEIPQVGVLKHSQEYILSAGRLEAGHHALNLADWDTAMGSSVTLSEYKDIRNFGSAHGLTVRSYADMPQFAYFMFFDVYLSSSAVRNLTINVSVCRKDGSTYAFNPGTITVTNFNIVRLPLSVSALGINPSDILYYTVHAINNSGLHWTRKFILERKPLHSQEFLLQNRYGLLESLYTDSEAVEEKTEGTDTVRNGTVGADITDTATIHTARTGCRPEREIQLVADAIRNRFNYRIVSGKAVPIAIIPDSLTVTDTAEDLISAEFQYRFNKPYTSASAGNVPIVPSLPDEWDDARIWIDDAVREAPQTNSISSQFNRTR